jgi:hypothetical protein
VPRGAAALLDQAAVDRKAGIRRHVEQRDELGDLRARHQLGVDAVAA